MIGITNNTNFSHHSWVDANEILIVVTLGSTTGSIKGKILRVIPRPWVGSSIPLIPLTAIQYSVAMPETVKVKLKALVAKAK